MSIFTVTNTNNSGAGSLRQGILNADLAGGTNIINFGGLFSDGLAHTINMTGSSLSITDNLTIEGTNPSKLTIKDDSPERVFYIGSGVTAAINGLTITNTYDRAAGGGAIYNDGVLTLSNSIITGNTTKGDPNYPNGGDSIGEGGGIYNVGSLTVNHSTITNNTADYGGGGIESISSLTVNNSSITDNTAKYYGGGIYLVDNSMNPIASSDMTISVSNSSISGNSAGTDGGGIYVGGNDYDPIASRHITISVSNSSISGNSAGTDGGGIYDNVARSGMYDTSGTIRDILSLTPKIITITNSIISGNSAGANGGGIYNYHDNSNNPYFISTTISVSNSLISGNSAGVDGGGIYNFGIITVTNSTINDNTAKSGGGGIYNGGFTYPGYKAPDRVAYGNLTMLKSIISDNSAFSGGGIYNNGTLSVSYSTTSDNYARHYGGGIYNSSSNEFSIFYPYDNHYDRYNTLGIITVSHSRISDNTAGTAGGGIYNAPDQDFGKMVEFIKGTDSYSTIISDGLGIVNVSNSSLTGNQAHFGGGIYNDGILTVGNSTIRVNKAFGIELSSGQEESGKGAGIYNSSDGTATINYSTIAGNFDTPEKDSNKFIKLDNLVGKFITKGSFVRV